MSRDEFGALFKAALETAAVNAERRLGITIPREFEIEFYGFGYSPKQLIDVNTAIDRLYLGEALYVFLVDVAVLGASSRVTRVYVRVSGHPPRVSIEETWNDPAGSGPFKQLVAFQFRALPD